MPGGEFKMQLLWALLAEFRESDTWETVVQKTAVVTRLENEGLVVRPDRLTGAFKLLKNDGHVENRTIRKNVVLTRQGLNKADRDFVVRMSP